MRLKTIFFLLACFSLNQAHASFKLDDQEMTHALIPLSSPNFKYELTTVPEKNYSQPHLKMTSQEVGKFVQDNGLNFEEQCLLVSHSPYCIEVQDSEVYAYDPNVQALISNEAKPLRIFKNQNKLQLNNCTIIAQDTIILEGDKIQVCGFFKTPTMLSLRATHQNFPIYQFDLSPHFFDFKSKTGMTLPSSSFWAAIDVDFAEKQFTLKWQGLSTLSINATPYKNIHGSPTKKVKKPLTPPADD